MINKTVFDRYAFSAQVRESDALIVYSGKDTQTNQTALATVVKPEIVSAKDFLTRFESVAKNIAQIQSSCAIHAMEFGEVDGQAVVVWENFEGKSLVDMLAGGNGLRLDQSLDLAQQLGKYLDDIHSRKIIHGVFAPEDIYISAENAARALNVGVWHGLNIGEALSKSKIKPTPYHAPELTRGEQPTIRSDFYSVGALLFKVLTGKEPDANVGESIEGLRADAPHEWNELIAKCMQSDPARRMQSAAEFINKVNEIQQATRVGQKSIMGMEDSLVGQNLGAYRLVERLGQGGMATVYKAYEAALDRYVAIKVLPQFFASDPTFTQRFRREAKAVAQLSHPNIVPIYSYGEENGITYIAMQFIEGGTLKHDNDQIFRSEEALQLLLPIARALGYAHKRGVVHRDVKPSNVLITEEGWPVLADFGLAQMAQASTKLTESGVGMGTPTYMSPEQGQGDKVDHRSDIYSFGIMLYELVTGEAPFRADTPMAVVIKHLTAPMPMPRQVNPNIPHEVEALILKATAKNPDDRFQTAEELALAMERALNLQSVKEEQRAEPSLVKQTVVSRAPAPASPPATLPSPQKPPSPAAPEKKVPAGRKILKTLVIALLLIIGLPCLGVTLMGIFNICPPEGPWDQPPWCPGSPYSWPFTMKEPELVSTPVVTEGQLGAILFQDDFEGGISPRWMFTASAYLNPWIAEEFQGRTVMHSLPPNPPGQTSDAEIRDTNWQNYAIQFDFRFLKPEQADLRYFAVRGRIKNCPPTIRSMQAYHAVVSPDRMLLQKSICKEGAQMELTQSDRNFDPDAWHTLQYTFIGNRVQVTIDGEKFLDYTDIDNPLDGGDLWLETGADGEVLFDNLKVYEIVPSPDMPILTKAPPTPSVVNTPFVPKAIFKIAVAVPMTGDMGIFGADIFNASQLAAEQLGNPLELMGYKVELVPYDDKRDIDTAVSNAKELVKDSDILCGVGHFTSAITIQATEIYHTAGLAFISPSSTNSNITERGYLEVNRVVGRDDAQGAAGAHFAREREFKSIYVLYDSSRHGQTNADNFKREAQKLGLNIVGELSTDIPNNFESVLRRILDANADLVYFVGGSTERAGNFINEARAAGYKGAILGTDYSFNPAILGLAGPFSIDGGGLFYTAIGANLASMPNAKQFEQDFRTKFGAEPQFYTPYAYDATGICMKAIENASNAKGGEIPTRAEVANAIRALVDYKGITDTYNFTKNGDPTVSIYQVYQVVTIDPNNWGANPVVATYQIEPPGK